MRTLLLLATLNAIAWIGFLATFPGSHFAWPGSYQFWWTDDLPWVVILVSVMVPMLIAFSRLRTVSAFKRASLIIAIFTLLAFVPYVVMSGGGV